MDIYGASGHAKVVIEIIHSLQMEKIDHVFDDNPEIKEIMGYKVQQPIKIGVSKGNKTVLAIGNNKIRKEIANVFSGEFVDYLAHFSAIISPTAILGKGTVVMANATINAEVEIGRHCIVNTGAVIEHEVILRDFVHISPNASIAGNVNIGEGTHIGIGATIIPGKTIGKWAKIGAGAVIIDDIPDFAVVVGNPGRIIRIEG